MGSKFMVNHLSTKITLREQLYCLKNPHIDVNFLSKVILEKTLECEVPILLDLHTFIDMQPAIGTLTSNYYIMMALGPVCFLGSYFILNDPSNLKTIFKNSIYTHTINRDFKTLYNFLKIPDLPFELNRTKSNLVVVLLGGIFICNVWGVNSPKITSSNLNSEFIKDIAENLIRAGENNIPTTEKNPILYPIRKLVNQTTFAITDIVFSAFRGVTSAYFTNLFEQTKPITDVIASNVPKK